MSFLLDLKIETDTKPAEESDNIDNALNYQTVYLLIQNEMKKKSFLLENIAKRILDCLYNEFPQIINAEIKVSKMHPPLGGQVEKVSIILTR